MASFNPTNYPSGFPNGVTLRNVPILGMHSSSRVFWVDSVSGADGNKGTFKNPLATLGQALTLTQAGRGDKIMLKAGHAETISTAGGITTGSMTEIEICGLGEGNLRPTFTFATSTAATFTITSAGVTLRNVVITNTLDQVVSPIVISAANVTLDMVEIVDSADAVEFVTGVLTTAAASGLKIMGMRYKGRTGGSHCATPIKLVGVKEGLIDINFYGKASTAVVNFATTACTGIRVYGEMYNSGTTNGSKNIVDSQGSSTWWANIFDGAAGAKMDGGSASALAFADTAMNETAVTGSTAVMVDQNTLFTIAGGPINVVELLSVCVTSNGSTASTITYFAVPTSGTSQALTSVSASLASMPAGATAAIANSTVATTAAINVSSLGPNVFAGGVAGIGTPNIFVPAGTIKISVGTGSTTGTWKHYLRYKPMAPGVSVLGT